MASFASPPPYRPNRATFWQDSFYYLDVSSLPVKADSAAITADILAVHGAKHGDTVSFKPFGTKAWNAGQAAGYFVDSLPSNISPTAARRTWAANAPQAQQPGKHLYFSNLRQQGAVKNWAGSYSAVNFGDRHAICYNEATNELMEVIGYSGFSPAGMHNATYDLQSYDMPFGPNGVTKAGAIAPRIPVAPFFFTYQDLLDCGSTGDLGHMIGFVLNDYRNQKQWPSRAGDGTRSTGPKSGEVLRLRADFDLASLPNDAMRAVARTLQKYGMLLFDRSDFPKIVTCNDPMWPSNFGGEFKWDRFQAVDLSSVAGTEDSIRLSITNAGNEVPVPSFTHAPESGATPLTVNFDASATTDPDGTISSYVWAFGDGASGTGVTASHTYTTSGTYTPTLTVVDNDGASASVAASGWSPQYVLDTPPDKVRFGVSCDTGMKAKFEDPISTPLSMYRRFFSWTQAVNGSMRTELLTNHTAGRSTWLSFKTPTTTTSWRDVAAGNYQAQVDAFLVGLRDTGINCWLTPYHEPEDNCDAEAPGNGSDLSGTAAEWRAMVRYIEARRKVVNANNVLIVPVLMASTFNSGTRDDADWVLLDADFPLYGIDPYTNDWATSPARLTSASFTAAVSALEAYGKDIAIAECGGAIGTTTPRPVGLWAGFVQECLDHDIKACCWFDVGTNDKLNASPGDPSGATYAAVLATFDGANNYSLGRSASTAAGPGTISVTGTPPPANTPPTAVATTTDSAGEAPFATSFSSSGSADGDGTIVSRSWSFGDGGTSTTTNPAHTYTQPGTYTVSLTVTDDDGATDTATLVVTVTPQGTPPATGGSTCYDVVRVPARSPASFPLGPLTPMVAYGQPAPTAWTGITEVDVRVWVRRDDWSALGSIINRAYWTSGNGYPEQSWAMYVGSTGELSFVAYGSGGPSISECPLATAGISDGDGLWVRAVYDSDTGSGRCRWYVSDGGPLDTPSWSLVHTDTGLAVTSLAAALETTLAVGHGIIPGVPTYTYSLGGDIGAFELWNYSTSTLVESFSTEDAPTPWQGLATDGSETWTSPTSGVEWFVFSPGEPFSECPDGPTDPCVGLDQVDAALATSVSFTVGSGTVVVDSLSGSVGGIYSPAGSGLIVDGTDHPDPAINVAATYGAQAAGTPIHFSVKASMVAPDCVLVDDPVVTLVGVVDGVGTALATGTSTDLGGGVWGLTLDHVLAAAWPDVYVVAAVPTGCA